MKILFRYFNHLSQKICIGVVFILLCTLAGTLFANSQIIRRIYLREQRDSFRQKGMGFHKLWLWDQDYIAATQKGVHFWISDLFLFYFDRNYADFFDDTAYH